MSSNQIHRRTNPEIAKRHLERALEADLPEKDYHIREALQFLVIDPQ